MSYGRFERFSAVSDVPRSFSGLHPTRLWIRTVRGNLPFEYAGKSVPSLKDWVGRSFFRAGGDCRNLTISEFDQNGLVRELQGGRFTRVSTFADMYFPLPSLLQGYLGRLGCIFALLDRELVSVDGVSVYSSRFWKDTAWEGKAQRMLRDAASRRVINGRWFSERECVDIATFVATVYLTKWAPRVSTPPSSSIERAPIWL